MSDKKHAAFLKQARATFASSGVGRNAVAKIERYLPTVGEVANNPDSLSEFSRECYRQFNNVPRVTTMQIAWSWVQHVLNEYHRKLSNPSTCEVHKFQRFTTIANSITGYYESAVRLRKGTPTGFEISDEEMALINPKPLPGISDGLVEKIKSYQLAPALELFK